MCNFPTAQLTLPYPSIREIDPPPSPTHIFLPSSTLLNHPSGRSVSFRRCLLSSGAARFYPILASTIVLHPCPPQYPSTTSLVFLQFPTTAISLQSYHHYSFLNGALSAVHSRATSFEASYHLAIHLDCHQPPA
jgi:hypothetical protein